MVSWRGVDWTRAGGALALSASVLAGAGTLPALADSAGDALLKQGIYWRSRNRPDLAIDALSRLLRAEPDRADALYQIAMAEAQSGHAGDATGHLAKFQQVAPSDPRINEIQLAIKAGTGTPPEIATARTEAQRNPDQAVQTYRRAFNGNPPPDQYALEYYSTLGGTNNPQNTEEARRGLEALIRNTGGDPRARLALGNSLINREGTRREGIQQLSQLADDPSIGKAAAERWHQGVVWLGPNPRDRDLMRAYLAKFPDDEVIRGQLNAADHPPTGPGADPAAKDRAVAFAALNGGNLDAAAAGFERTLRTRPGDADALGGLGLVRLRQERFVDARDLLARAGGARGRYASAYASAAFYADLAQARQAIAAGNNAQGIALARQALTHPNPEQSYAELLLGDTLANSGDLAGAEQYYRTVLARDPQNADALIGLFGVLIRQNRPADAQLLVARLNQADRSRVPGLGRIQGEVLRIQAQAADRGGQYAQAGLLYSQALQADPTSPYLRLDYARFLVRQGNVAQANTIVAGLTQSLPANGRLPPGTRQADVFYAAALYYNDQNRPVDALAMLGRIAPAERSAEINALYDRLAIAQYADRAVQIARAGNVLQAQQLLAQLRQQGALSLDRSQVIAQAYLDIGDQANALQVAQEGLARAPQAPPGALLQYVGILLATQQPAAAASIISRLDATPGLTATQQRDLARLHADLISDNAARAAGFGDIPGAYTLVVTELGKYPGDAALTLSLARIYAAAGRPEDALNLYDRVLVNDPRNIDAIRGAVGAAIDAKDTSEAYDLINQGIEYYPDNARLYYLKSQVARAAGDRLTAVSALQEARRLLRSAEPPASYAAPVYGLPAGRPAFQLPPVPPAGPPRPLAPAGTPGRQSALETIIVDASAISLTAAHLSADEAPPLERQAVRNDAAKNDDAAIGGGHGDDPSSASVMASTPAAQLPAAPVGRPPIQVAQLMPVPMAQAMPVQIAQAQIMQAMPVQLAQMTPQQMMPVQLAQMQVGPGQFVQVPMQMAQMPMQQMPVQMAQAPVMMPQGMMPQGMMPQGMVPVQMAQAYPGYQPAYQPGYQMVYAPPQPQPQVYVVQQQPMMMAAPMYQPAPMYPQPYPMPGYAAPAYTPPFGSRRPLFQPDGQGVYMAAGGQALPPVPPAPSVMAGPGYADPAYAGQPAAPSPVNQTSATPSTALAPLPANQELPGEPYFAPGRTAGQPAAARAYQAPAYQVPQAPVMAAPSYQAPAYPAPAYQPPAYQQAPGYPNSSSTRPPLFNNATPLAQAPAPYAQPQQQLSLSYAPSAAGGLPPLTGSTAQPGFDPLQQDIDASLAQLRGETRPFIKGGVGGDYRDGEDGLSRLFTITAPFSFTFNPGFFGNVTVGAAPTYASAGSIATDEATLRRFGTNSIQQSTTYQAAISGRPASSFRTSYTTPGNQDASGIGLNLAYASGPVSVDVGTTPLGFQETHVVGGVSYAPKLNDELTLRLEAARRPVVESLLSYAGTKDGTGARWGGVVRQGARVELDYDDGDFGLYGGGGYYLLRGDNVAHNTDGEGLLGAYIRPYRRTNAVLKTGINLAYSAYAKNLRYFTYGQGGYFSPQNYGAISFPVEYQAKSGKLAYLAGAALGLQAFSEKSSAYFPTNSGFQTTLNNFAASDSSTQAIYPGRSSTGVLINLRGQVEYELRPSLVVGGSATFNNARDYNEGSLLVYFKALLGGSSSSRSSASTLGSNDGVFSMVRGIN